MPSFKILFIALAMGLVGLFTPAMQAQDLPTRYATLELFTNTPCPICGSQNPGLFSRLANYEGKYHLISFYPGKPYSSCVFYQDNIAENTTRFNHYQGEIFGSPTVALNGIDFKSSSGVTNAVLDNLTGGTSWLHVDIEETTGTSREVTIRLEDVIGGSLASGRLFAVIVEKEVFYNAPNGETIHRNVFRRFLTASTGEDIDLSSGNAIRTYQYDVDNEWNAGETYVIAWLSDPTTEEIYNSGTRFDPDFTSAVDPELSIVPLKLYPNPATDIVTLTLPAGVLSADIQLYDYQGKRVYQFTSQYGPEIHINTADLVPGQYLVRLVAGQKVFRGGFQVVQQP